MRAIIRQKLVKTFPCVGLYLKITRKLLAGSGIKLRPIGLLCLQMFGRKMQAGSLEGLAVTKSYKGHTGLAFLARSLTRRNPEVGLRKAVGAQARGVPRLIVSEGWVGLAGIGCHCCILVTWCYACRIRNVVKKHRALGEQ